MSAREPAQDSASFVEGLDADVREFLREWGIDPAADLATVRADARELADIRARWIADSAPGGDAEEIAAAAREADRCAALADRYCRALDRSRL